MHKWMLKSLVAAVVGVLAFAGQANAAVSYSYVTDQTNYLAAAGTPVTVKLYLLETLTGGSTSVINSDGGLLGFGVQATRSNGDATITNYAGNDADFGTFPNPKPTVPAGGVTSYKFSQGIAAGAATGVNTGTGANPLPNAIYLGNLTIQAGAGPSTFSVLPYDTGGGNSLTNTSFYDLDFTRANAPAFIGASSNPTTFVIGVPEPTFAGVAMILGAAGSLIRRRRPQA